MNAEPGLCAGGDGRAVRAGQPRRGAMLAGAIAAAAVLGSAGCTTAPTAPSPAGGSAAAVGAAQPGSVEGYLFAAVERQPYTPAEQADPTWRSVVEQCERSGGQGCREKPVPADRRRAFARSADPGVYAQFVIWRLSAGQAYTSACHFVDPAGSTVKVVRNTVVIPRGAPRDASMTFTCGMELGPTRELGAWTVLYTVNEKAAATLRFEVTDSRGERSA